MIDTEKFKKLLLEKERELLSYQKMSAESEKPVSLDDPIGRITRIDALQRQHQALHAKERTERTLTAIREALLRIEAQTYGICVKCEKEINPERLEFLPETTVCTQCMRAMSR
ncbi:TraR/DksA C4-type zinc finger protein [Chitinispirillales bacterium ANBcel5]|uniref:TraR/DksA family transcriptional regulator n=1 Tax=Cellulosispirillum alkaliphilum TaxID=3039283 RepID=UPI002A5580A4|nr:TraR/DksA C4-type zinc finger protein [Chitinispirillales bacterium ANBcel5]